MTSVQVPRPTAALLILVGVGLCWLIGTSTATAAPGSPSSPTTGASAEQTLGPADPSSPSASGLHRTSAATTTAVPTHQTPTNATNNEPGLVIGTAIVAVALIGGGAVVARHRLADDEHE